MLSVSYIGYLPHRIRIRVSRFIQDPLGGRWNVPVAIWVGICVPDREEYHRFSDVWGSVRTR